MITKLKNRYGHADVNMGFSFFGEMGMFRELPKPEEISDYEPYLVISNDKMIHEEDTIEEEENKYVFKF